MEKITTIVNEKTAKELSMKNQILAIGAFFFGLICIGMYFLFSYLDGDYSKILYVILLGLGGMLVGVSIILEIGLLKRIRIYKENGYEATYEFFDKNLTLQAFRNGEKFQDAKIKYEDIYGYWELKNYVIIRLHSMDALPISKVSGLTEFFDSKGVLRRKR